jgi:sec-independent protein translocase protein TatA
MQTIPILGGLVPGGSELLLVLAIVLLLFGGTKLPALARGLGQSVKEFKKASREGDDDGTPKPPAAPATAEIKKVDIAKPGPGSN